MPLETANPSQGGDAKPRASRRQPAERNPDGVVHALVEKRSGDVDAFGFEDIFDGGDMDYNDCMFEVRGVEPEPEDFETPQNDDAH